ININDYTAASEISLEEREKELKAYIQSIQNTNYRKLVEGLLNKVGNKFFTYPAASKIHHSFLGGLSEHSLSMARMCDKIAEHYPQLDRDLLVSGALVHDIGKTSEMSGPITTEYTLEGKLEGHISIANGWLTEVADELGLAQEEEAILLHHMILSHHGHLEFGSPVLPLLQEAEVLCLIDNLDARLNTLKTALDGVKEGSWTSKLFALENRQFYKQRKK
ncbi:MAG: HD domain-containing protein, partial [Solobacterium sp.]|nr:HD domain-containing protein [Solobacterium sp.]